MTLPTTRHDWVLHAYVDGELEPSEKLLIEKELAGDHEARQSIEVWRRQNEVIRETFADVVREQLPPGVRAALGARRAKMGRWFVPWVVAAAVAVLAGGYALYEGLGLGTGAGRDLVENALSAHVVYAAEVRHAVEVSAAEKPHLDSWLSKRLGHQISAPDLSSHGFQLIGGRLLHEGRRPAAQFMYEDGSKRRLTVYVAGNPSKREISLRLEQSMGYTTCYWLDENAGYAVAGELKPAELLPLAMFIYEAFEGGEG
jgi:anti-sigma factor RsiW